MGDEPGLEEVRAALAEDRAREDVTTRLLGPIASRLATARFVAESRFVVAGTRLAGLVFRELDPRAVCDTLVADGDWAEPGVAVATVRASADVLLAGERVALNFMQRLCGIATLTRKAVEAVAGTGARITHTRKTTPGLRALECYAVRVGGGVDNRASLADAVLWKDNHWALLAPPATLVRALAGVSPGLDVIVEVESDEQLETALAAGAKHILADNQPPERVALWVRRAGPGVTLQASGGISVEQARAYAMAGARLIAIGALTHSASAAGIRMEVTAASR